MGKIKLAKQKGVDVKLPDDIDKSVRVYMLTNMKLQGPASRFSVRLWNTYRDTRLDRKIHEQHCVIGDVGYFRDTGGFEVKFNIFKSKKDNIRMKYEPPENFQPFPKKDYVEKKPTMDTDVYYTEDLEREKRETGTSVYTFKSKQKPDTAGGVLLLLPQGCAKWNLTEEAIPAIEGYFNDFFEYSDLVLDGSLKLISATYRAKVWGGAALRKSRYRAELLPDLQAKFRQTDVERNFYEWETHREIAVTASSHDKSVEGLSYTVAMEVYEIRRGPAPSRLSSIFSGSSLTPSVSSRSSFRSFISLGLRK